VTLSALLTIAVFRRRGARSLFRIDGRSQRLTEQLDGEGRTVNGVSKNIWRRVNAV
jgi:hypothetical protein